MDEELIKPDCALHGIFENCKGVCSSEEHIIPNAIGGRIKNANCICSICNNKSGHQWDAVLCKQFNFLCVCFGVQRERGDVQNEIIKNFDGEELIISPQGTVKPRHPTHSEKELGEDRVSISVQSTNKKQAIKIIKGIAKKKGYSYDAEDIEYSEFLLDGGLYFPQNFDLAGPEVGRSLIKMIYLFSICNGLNRCDMPNAWHYLSTNPSPQCFCPYYKEDPVVDRPVGVPIHVLYVVGDSKEKILYGYIELFGLFKYIVLLSDHYTGDDVRFKHVLDPTKGEYLDVSVNLNLGKDSLLTNLRPTNEAAEASNLWIREKMPLYMANWMRRGEKHRLGILLKKFILEYGLGSLSQLSEWLDNEL